MFVDRNSRQATRLQNAVFLLLFLGVIGTLAWLSNHYHLTADWTASGRNTLSAASDTLLRGLDGPVQVTAFATEDDSVRGAIRDLLARYQRAKPDIRLTFVNPDLAPARARELDIRINGELLVAYRGREEKLTSLSEQALSNALQRLARQGERWLVFLTGHGERKPRGEANFDLGAWGRRLTEKGFKLRTQNLTEEPALADNTAALVLASPQTDLLPGEVSLIRDYVAQGGNLLWLTEPGADHGLLPLAESLGVAMLPGAVVDPTTRLLGIDDPRLAIVSTYPPHPVTRGFDVVTLFPQAVALRYTPAPGWQGQALLVTGARSWAETGALSGQIAFDAGSDTPGPLTLGVVMSRPRAEGGDDGKQATAEGEQRVAVIGDGDFLTNAYLGNGGNLDLGLRLAEWLAHDDRFIDIPAKPATDRSLVFSPLAQGVIGLGWLVLLPLGLAAAGGWIWWRRRKR